MSFPIILHKSNKSVLLTYSTDLFSFNEYYVYCSYLFFQYFVLFSFLIVCGAVVVVCRNICMSAGATGDVACPHFILSLNQELIPLFPLQLGCQLASLSDPPASVVPTPQSGITAVCSHAWLHVWVLRIWTQGLLFVRPVPYLLAVSPLSLSF